MLSQERFELLDAIDEWEWDAREAAWQRHFEALQQFVAREGHARVPKGHVEIVNGEHLRLGSWVGKQRQDAKNGKLAADRRKLLDQFPDWL